MCGAARKGGPLAPAPSELFRLALQRGDDVCDPVTGWLAPDALPSLTRAASRLAEELAVPDLRSAAAPDAERAPTTVGVRFAGVILAALLSVAYVVVNGAILWALSR